MKKRFPVSRTLKLVAAMIAIALCAASSSGLAQTDGQSATDPARQAQITALRGKIEKLQAQLKKLESAQPSHVGSESHGMGGMAGMGGGMGGSPAAAQGMEHGEGMAGGAGASPATSPGSMPMEHNMGMGGGGMEGGGMSGGGMTGGGSGAAQPQASPAPAMGGDM